MRMNNRNVRESRFYEPHPTAATAAASSPRAKLSNLSKEIKKKERQKQRGERTEFGPMTLKTYGEIRDDARSGSKRTLRDTHDVTVFRDAHLDFPR